MTDVNVMEPEVLEVELEKAEDGNPIEAIDDSAVQGNGAGQVVLAVDPNEPEEEVQEHHDVDSEMKEAIQEFSDVMEEILEEAEPRIEATLDPDTQLSETSERSVEIGGYNPDEEQGDSELIDKIVEAATPAEAQVVPTEIVDAADRVMNAANDEGYKEHEKTFLFERDEDKEEEILDKVEDLQSITSGGTDNPEYEVSNNEDCVYTAAIESSMEELTEIIEALDESKPDVEGTGNTLEVEVDGFEPEERATTYDDVHENAQIGEIEITSIQTITPEGVAETEVDITLPSIDESPLDEYDGDEVVHTGTIDEVDVSDEVRAEVEEAISGEVATEEEEITEIVTVDTDGEVVSTVDVEAGVTDVDHAIVEEGDLTDAVMRTAAEGFEEIDCAAIDEFAARLEAGENPDEVEADYRYVLDETKEIEAAEGPIASDFDETDYTEAFDKFINDDSDMTLLEDGDIVE
ncbi:MAG: hypothetical protein ACRCX2_28105 [Paraclostridium sp.]